MKWKNNVVIFAVFFVGKIYGLSIEEKLHELESTTDRCFIICSNGYEIENTDFNTKVCSCPNNAGDPVSSINDKQSYFNSQDKIKYTGRQRKKRQTIKELIEKRNKINKTPIFSTAKTSKGFKINKKNEKPQAKPRTSGLFSNPRAKEFEDRMNDLKAKLSIKPRFQSRSAFSEDHKPQTLIKQLKDKREEMLKDFKLLQSKSIMGKDSTALKERVGSINHLQNQIDTVSSNLKNKLKERADDRKNKIKGNKINPQENDANEVVGSINKQSTTIAKPKTTSSIPEIVLGQTESTAPKTETIAIKENVRKSIKKENLDNPIDAMEASTKKIEPVSLTLEKIKEKQKEAVMKIKDKLSVGKKSKDLEIVDDVE